MVHARVNIIVAFSTRNFGIGLHGSIPWHIKEDMFRFKKITQGSVIVMGRKTWESLPTEHRPLVNRLNVVVTRQADTKTVPDSSVVFVHPDNLDQYLGTINQDLQVFVIGGTSLYNKFMGKAHRIYTTQVDKEIQADTFFPTDGFGDYVIEEYSPSYYSEHERCNYVYITYKLRQQPHPEESYLESMRAILENGSQRNDRTGTGTRSLFAQQMRFDISHELPLVTTKQVGFKTILKELLFFIKGQTNSKLLEQNGVNIWKANTTRAFLDARGLTDYQEGDMGPMYGFNWRFFGAKYTGSSVDYTNKGFDQLADLIEGLKNDPFSRRHMITTFNPAEVKNSVLAPCHGIVAQFYVDAEPNNMKSLSCHMYQRSQDTFLGCPFNIASYAILTHIIAKMVDMRPKELVISNGDAHIYNNHVEQVAQQLARKPLPLPVLEVLDTLKNKKLEDISLEDFKLVGYLHHPAIKAPMAV